MLPTSLLQAPASFLIGGRMLPLSGAMPTPVIQQLVHDEEREEFTKLKDYMRQSDKRVPHRMLLELAEISATADGETKVSQFFEPYRIQFKSGLRVTCHIEEQAEGLWVYHLAVGMNQYRLDPTARLPLHIIQEICKILEIGDAHQNVAEWFDEESGINNILIPALGVDRMPVS